MEIFWKVYHADVSPLASSALFERGLAEVPETRKAKVLRMIPPAGKRLSLGAGLLLNRALSDCGLDPQALRLAESAEGKPFLPDVPDLYFNLSHSGTRVLCSLSNRPCGCDVEEIGRGSPALVRRFFAPEEQKALDQLQEDFQLEFTRIWTMKESYLKATGEGFSRPAESFSVLSLPPSVVFREGPEDAGYVSMTCLLSPVLPPDPEWIPVSFDV